MGQTSVGGKKAYQFGKGFEEHFDLIAKMRGVLCISFPRLGARKAGPRFIPQKMPFDRVLWFQGVSVTVDLKTFDSESISRTHLLEHQVETLESIERFGGTAGYLIWFRKPNVVAFCKASRLRQLMIGELNSIHAKDMIFLGQIEDFYLGRLFSLQWEK